MVKYRMSYRYSPERVVFQTHMTLRSLHRTRIRALHTLCAGAVGLTGFLIGPVATPDAQAAAKAHSACSPRGASTLARTGSVRVYKRGRDVAACYHRTGRVTALGQQPLNCFPDTCTFGPLRATGNAVAYGFGLSGRLGSQYILTVIDARSGRRIRVARQGGGEYFGQPGTEAATLRDVELRRNGSIAWIAEVQKFVETEAAEGRQPPTLQVRRADRSVPGRGGSVLVDESGDIDPLSLMLSGTTLRWTRAGGLVTASLL